MSINPASLAFVVDIRGVKTWKILGDHEPLAMLHAAFWGKSIAEDPGYAKRRSTSNPREIGNGADVSEDDDADKVEDGEESDDDGKTAYVLEINNPGIYIKKILAEYIRIYNYIVDYYDRKTKHEGKAPLAVVTGQPGIGKSVWIFYALCRCLAERRPVIWRYNLKPYIFVEEGVYRMGKNFLDVTYKRFVWTLIDSDESHTCIPLKFVQQNSPFFVVYASSPVSNRWSRAHKTVSFPKVVVMNPWSRIEIHRAAPLHSNSPNLEFIDEIFDQFGPTPRLCLEIAADDEMLEEYKNAIRDALNDLTPESLGKFSDDLQKLKMDAISHKLCLIRRENKHNVKPGFLVMPITDYIRSELVIRMRNSSMRQLIKTYHKSFPILALRGMCGTVFESICHLRFQKQILIRHMKMVRLSKPSTFLWRSSHNPIDDPRLKRQRNAAFEKRVILKVHPSNTHVYDGEKLSPVPGVYYIAKKSNQAAFDSFIYYKDTLYLFHFTVSGYHDINDGLIAECDKLSIPEAKRLFIFVIPDGVKLLKSPYQKNPGLRWLEPRSAEIVVKELEKPVGSTEEPAESMKISAGSSKEAEGPVFFKKRKITGAEEPNDGEGSKLREKPRRKERK